MPTIHSQPGSVASCDEAEGLIGGKNNVFTIAPHEPFLPTLAKAIVTGRLIEGFCPAENPLELSSATLYLPTRRAARGMGLALTDAMERATGMRAAILPRIRTLGDMDEEESLDDIGGSADDLAHFMQAAASVINAEERELTLARLARSWINTMQPEERELFDREHIVLPSSSADAIRLARDLAAFMDQIETEEVDPANIGAIVPEDHARWWALTARFLTIILESWPNHLQEAGKINPAQFRKHIADFRIARLDGRTDQSGPVIAAGSTGSIPATARLLTAIARTPRGAVVLPGLDCGLPETVFRNFCEDSELSMETASSTHPQYAMACLLKQMGSNPQTVEKLTLEPHLEPDSLRIDAIHTALLPPKSTSDWRQKRQEIETPLLEEAFRGCALVEARNERQEALTIALILREVLKDPEKTAALVTPDRDLARRVSAELQRFDIGIDDSAGTPLVNSEAVRACRQLLRVVNGADHACWSAYFKGPFAKPLLRQNGKVPSDAPMETLMELALIRDCLTLPNVAMLASDLNAARARIEAARHVHPLLKQMNEADWLALNHWAEQIERSVEPLCNLLVADGEISVGDLAQGLLTFSENPGIGESLFSQTGGEALYDFLVRHSEKGDVWFSFPAAEAAAVFDALLAGKTVRQTARTHPRLQIFGALEARLQDFDRIVLGGLNEGVWPPKVRNDPFLNRPMRSEIGLPLPERRIGLAAHDFVQLSGHGEVFYTRSTRSGDAPSIACRWLQRLETFCGDTVFKNLRERGGYYTRLANEIDAPSGPPARAARAEACPPVEERPKKLSITEIETWIRDPYAIYAKHVLGLRPFPPLLREADAALKGSLYHDIFADFIQNWRGPITEQARDALTKTADKHFDSAALAPEIDAMWRPRFDEVAEAFLDWEREWRDGVRHSHCEVSGYFPVADTGFILSGRADRIDELKDGQIAIIDYKTGQMSSGTVARTLDPQLALAGAMAREGAFKDVTPGGIGAFRYVALRPGKAFVERDITMHNKKQLIGEDELADTMMDRLIERIKEYQSADQTYISRYAAKSEVQMSGDYDHLARVREWSIGEDESSGEEDA